MTEQSKLEQKIETAVTVAVSHPSVPASLAAVPAIVDALSKLVPEIMNATNKEPFYRSRIFWGQMLALVAVIAGLFGVTFTADMQNQTLLLITAASPLIGIGITLYGRFFAKKPLGS